MTSLIDVFASEGAQLVVAGGCGGLSRWITLVLLAKNPAVGQGLAMTLLGAILGFYASPSFEGVVRGWIPGLSVDPEKFPTFVAFVTGVGGIAVIALVIDLWSNFRKQPAPPAAVDPVPPKS